MHHGYWDIVVRATCMRCRRAPGANNRQVGEAEADPATFFMPALEFRLHLSQFASFQLSVTFIMAAASSPAISQHAKNETLRCAVHEFESVLDDSQRLELRRMKDVPSVDTVLTFTAELDLSNRQRKGRSFASRLFPILDSVRSFCSVVDTFVSSRPETAALVWGSVRITMLVRMVAPRHRRNCAALNFDSS